MPFRFCVSATADSACLLVLPLSARLAGQPLDRGVLLMELQWLRSIRRSLAENHIFVARPLNLRGPRTQSQGLDRWLEPQPDNLSDSSPFDRPDRFAQDHASEFGAGRLRGLRLQSALETREIVPFESDS